MPDLQLLNSVPTTVSEKLNSLAQQATGAVAGIGGSISSGINGFGTALGAASGKVSNLLQSAGNLSLPSLSKATQQIVGAVQPTSLYRGAPKGVPFATELQPSDTRPEVSSSLMRFPDDLGVYFIKFEFSQMAKDNVLNKEIRTKQVSILLPMSPNLVETYQANYKTENLGVLGKVGEGIATEFLNTTGGKINEASGKALGAIINKTVKEEGANAATALLAQAGMNATGSIGAAVSKSLGASVNPNLAVLFDNVSFRSHSFNFKLFPKSAKESEALKKIIRTFKERMLPPTINQFFFGYPDKVKIEIQPNTPYPILDCVLESMTVNYAPNGPAFFGGGKGNPVEIDLTLNFREIEIFTRDTIKKLEK